MDAADDGWVSIHLYYHESLDRAVTGFVHPTVLSLLRSSWIDGFFFVRYGLGGPHIRLRLHPSPGPPGRAEEIARMVRERAERFLGESPSTASQEEEAIRRSNAAILAADPHETEDSVHPDNSFLAVPFRPETHRYGGPELLPASLDFFTLSSALALDVLSRHGHEARARQLQVFLRLLLRLAVSFAADEGELLDLAGYGVASWGEALPTILAKGDKVFAGQRDLFRELFLQQLRSLSPPDPPTDLSDLLSEAARRLSGIIGPDDLQKHRRIGISQLHMTATRLGLSNVEEVYLSRLLTNAGQALLEEQGSEVFSPLKSQPREPANGSLHDLLPRALALLQESPS